MSDTKTEADKVTNKSAQNPRRIWTGICLCKPRNNSVQPISVGPCIGLGVGQYEHTITLYIRSTECYHLLAGCQIGCQIFRILK